MWRPRVWNYWHFVIITIRYPTNTMLITNYTKIWDQQSHLKRAALTCSSSLDTPTLPATACRAVTTQFDRRIIFIFTGHVCLADKAMTPLWSCLTSINKISKPNNDLVMPPYYQYQPLITTFPQCNFSLEFSELLSQNQICNHWLSVSGILKIMQSGIFY